MIQHLSLKGELQIGQHKCIGCDVKLEVATLEDDEWAESDQNPKDYIDGVRVRGELSFECPPIESRENHPVKKSQVVELILRDKEDSTKINALLVDQTGIVDVIPKITKRYFWLFFAVGKPVWDHLEIFPKNYRGKTMNRVFVCTDFRGYWPISVSSVIVAIDKKEAKQLLKQKLREVGISPEGDCSMTEIDIQNKDVFVLNAGE